MQVFHQWIERGSKATPVLYLDLDDTVRMGKDTLGRFVNKSEDVQVFPEVPAILAEYKKHGWRIVAISNQGGVALGLLTEEDCFNGLMETQRQCKGAFDKMMACFHHPDAPDPEYAICWCRKPRIGLILEAATALAAKHNEYYPPHLALFVGDRPEDKQCAENANVRFMDAREWREGGWRNAPAAIGYTTVNATNNAPA
jgi:D-glycero-D-manno-heptose 1,7-bisphosphate phosphatase